MEEKPIIISDQQTQNPVRKGKNFPALLGIIVLIFSLFAGFFLVRGRLTTQNKAQENMCTQKYKRVICKMNSTDTKLPYLLEIIDPNGSVVSSGGFKAGEVGSIEYPSALPANPVGGGKYICKASYPDSTTVNGCSSQVSGEKNCGPVPTGPQQCQCNAGGLDCNNELKTEKYRKEDQPAPGLIELNPKIGDPGACYECKRIIITSLGKDGKRKEVEIYDCAGKKNGFLFPTPTVMRIHEAKIDQCRDYKVEMEVNKIGNTEDTQICATCDQKVCCPVCLQPTVLPDPNDKEGRPSCDNQCNYKFKNFPAACPNAGESVKIEIQQDGRQCLAHDKGFDSEVKLPARLQPQPNGCTQNDKEVCCDFKKGDIVEVPYPNAGVFDMKLRCSLPEVEPEVACVQRFSIACGNPNTGGGGPPGGGGGGTPPVTPQVTPGSCPDISAGLGVKISCPNCTK